jgi:hypothetical protein
MKVLGYLISATVLTAAIYERTTHGEAGVVLSLGSIAALFYIAFEAFSKEVRKL